MEVPENPHDLLLRWRHRARSNQQAHYKMAIRLNRTAFTSGALSALLSASVTVLVLFAAKTQPTATLSIITLVISIVVTAITTISTSSKWSDRASEHHAAGVEYGKVFRKIEELLACPIEVEQDAAKALKAIREKLDRIPSEAPAIPPRIWKNLPRELTPEPITTAHTKSAK
jgi:hypothetical protein